MAYGGAAGYSAEQMEHLLTENFREWGPMRAPPFVVPSKAIAFVRYHWRATAEFAKEAMHGQGLEGSKFDVSGCFAGGVRRTRLGTFWPTRDCCVALGWCLLACRR